MNNAELVLWITTNIKQRPDVVKRKFADMYEQIVEATNWLPPTVSLRQRYYHILNSCVIIPICPTCKTKNLCWNEQHRGYSHFCSHQCLTHSSEVRHKIAETNLKKYGGTAPTKCAAVREKRNQTNLLKYGDEHHTRVDSIKRKKERTNIERYGVDNPTKNKEIAAKVKTKLQAIHKERGQDIREQTVITCMNRYGVDNPTKVARFQEKRKQTNLKIYGTPYSTQSEVVREKTRQTNLKKFGSVHFSQPHMVHTLPMLTDRDWLYEEYVTQKKTMTAMADTLGVDVTTIGRYLDLCGIDRCYNHNYSHKCILWLEIVMKTDNCLIRHAHNAGEFPIPNTKFKADGYCEETNTIYEFYGDLFHGNPDVYSSEDKCHPFSELTAGQLYQKTIDRENKIKELGYNLVVMWENDWNRLTKAM